MMPALLMTTLRAGKSAVSSWRRCGCWRGLRCCGGGRHAGVGGGGLVEDLLRRPAMMTLLLSLWKALRGRAERSAAVMRMVVPVISWWEFLLR